MKLGKCPYCMRRRPVEPLRRGVSYAAWIWLARFNWPYSSDISGVEPHSGHSHSLTRICCPQSRKHGLTDARCTQDAGKPRENAAMNEHKSSTKWIGRAKVIELG